jgi:hypothetical protein
MTLGIYDDLRDAYGPRFTSVFGQVFEQCLGELLRSTFSRASVTGEQAYGPRKEFRSTDWVVREGDRAVLFECKVTRLSPQTAHTADPEALQRELRLGVVKALTQLDRAMRDITLPAPGLEAYRDVRQMVPVVLVFEPYYGVHGLARQRLLTG